MGKLASILYVCIVVDIIHRLYLMMNFQLFNKLIFFEKVLVISSVLIFIWFFTIISWKTILKPVWSTNIEIPPLN